MPPASPPQNPNRILATLLISVHPYGVLGSIIVPGPPTLQQDLDASQNAPPASIDTVTVAPGTPRGERRATSVWRPAVP